ncbi:MAG: ribonuclease P protein component [Spirochaetia bacterium]|nr:ribonuclease P protein component [Spirochaetia bacterium]
MFRGGRRIPQRGITLIVHKDETGNGGLAVCISRPKNAVHRNRLRRIAREAINPIVPLIRTGWSIAIFPDSVFLNATLDDRSALAKAAFTRADLLESA